MYKNDQEAQRPIPALASELAQRSADKADRVVAATESVVNATADAVNDGLEQLRDSGTSALTGVAAQTDALTRKGVESALRAAAALREKAQVTGDRTVGYIREQPVKAVVMAAAVGVLLGLVLGRRDHSR